MPLKVKLKPVKPPECFVWGSLALVLRVSRFFGLAPLQFIARRHGWRASVSPALHVYSYFVLLFLNAGVITGLIIDLNIPSDRSVRVRTPTATAVWLIELVIVLLLIDISFMNATNKMKELVHIVSLLSKVKPNPIVRKGIRSAEFKRYIFAATWMSGCGFIYCGDFYTFLMESIYKHRELKVIGLYSCFIVSMYCVILLQMQFVFIGFHVCAIIADINNAMRDYIYMQDTQGLNYSSRKENIIANVVTSNHNKSINKIIDTMTFSDKMNRPGTVLKPTKKQTQEAVRKLIVSYSTICDVIETVEKIESKQTLGILGLCFLRLIISPYYLVSFTRSENPRGINLGFQGLLFMFHVFTLFMLVEPGHRTQKLLEKTERLVSQLLRTCHTSDPLTEELEMFHKQIVLNKNVTSTCYSPLGVCTLTRPLIATVFGGITTYLVIILQFQTLDKPTF